MTSDDHSTTASPPVDDRAFPLFDPAAPLPVGRLLIEASAGTGKTYTISSLAVRFVAERDDVGAAGLCVVSFTEAATAELRSRIRERMAAVADLVESGAPTTDEIVLAYRERSSTEQDAVISRLRRATDEFDRAAITTIHGFCSRVLAALGVPVGALGSGGPEVDEVVNDLLLTTARHLAGRPTDDDLAVDDDPPDLPTVTPSRFAEAVAGLVRLPLATMDGADGSPPGDGAATDVDELIRQVGAAVLEGRQLVAERRHGGAVRSFDSLLTDVRALLDPAAGATDATRAAVRAALAQVRVLMVDEFQDTDGLQWAIFDNAFPSGTCPIVLVGDPKQSIYRFRSAEVSTYLDVRSSDGMDVASLGTNYRSDKAVLDGIERLYLAGGSGDPYPLGTDASATPSVHFRPVGHHHTGRRLHGMSRPQAVEVRVLSSPAADKVPAGVRRVAVADDVAWEVSHLLRAADESTPEGRVRTAVRIDDDGAPGGIRDLRPSDIAILVNTNAQAVAIAHRLARSGIAAATATTSSVLDGAAAWQWRLLLAALARPAAPGPVRAAALGWFIGRSADDLVGPDADSAVDHELVARWARVLVRGGPVAVLTEARRHGLDDRLLRRSGGERRITDLEHIAELLQTAVGTHPAGPLEVAEVLDALADGGGTEAAVDQMARRIDRDDEAVQVLTVHRAKGLEFPIVLCPYLWPTKKQDELPHAAVPDGRGGMQRRVWTPWVLHRSYPSKAADLGDFALPRTVTRGSQSVADWRRLELMEEADRVVYVALTRATAHLVVWWASPANARGHRVNDQALARLLSHATSTPAHDLVATPAVVEALAGDHVAVETIDAAAEEPRRAERPRARDLDRAQYTRGGGQRWRRWSYSRLSDRVGAGHDDGVGAGSAPSVVVDPDEGRVGGADERVIPGVGGGFPAPGGGDPFGTLGGTRFGTMVHGVLERVDFTSSSLTADLTEALAAAMAHWKDAALAPRVAAGLASALAAPLDGPLRADDTRLVVLPSAHRLNELRFDLALAPTSVGELVDILADDPAVSASFGPWLDRLDAEVAVEGMLTGSIDLVGTFDGEQYWVADHKTNRLVDGYGPGQLVEAMAAHDYPLQATLYLVALHRFLVQRLAGYDPERHLAGAAYLFVRGMPAGGGQGIAWLTPDPRTIVAVSDLLAGEVSS